MSGHEVDIDMDWQEVGFIQAWAREVEDDE